MAQIGPFLLDTLNFGIYPQGCRDGPINHFDENREKIMARIVRSRAQKTNLSKPPEFTSKPVNSLFKEGRDLFSREKQKISLQEIQRLIDYLLIYGRLETSFNFIGFFDWYGILSKTYYRIKEANPNVQLVHDHVHEMIGTRREKMMGPSSLRIS